MSKVKIRDIYGIDGECIPICEAMNKFKGIATTESCCGHGKTPFHIFFKTSSLKELPALLYCVDYATTGLREWRVLVMTDSTICPAYFLLEGPIGRQAYLESLSLARKMNKFLEMNKEHAE